jgi:hypothetical protein
MKRILGDSFSLGEPIADIVDKAARTGSVRGVPIPFATDQNNRLGPPQSSENTVKAVLELPRHRDRNRENFG